jgi:hypothetical protein
MDKNICRGREIMIIKFRRPLVFAEEVFEDFHITTSENGINLATKVFTIAGRPFVAGQNWNVIIDPGVVIGGTGNGTESIDGADIISLTAGLFPRILKITVKGSIIGSGGTGGVGGIESGSKDGGLGGGGGGGAGVPAGPGGDGDAPATDGGPGSSSLGGTDGEGSIVFDHSPERLNTVGGAGGTAILLSVNQDTRLIIEPGGIVAGGGGGGGGATGVGVQVGPVNRYGGVGGKLGSAGVKGGSGIDQRYSETGSGSDGGRAGLSVKTANNKFTLIQNKGQFLGPIL